MFGDYMRPDLDPDERVYEEVTSIDNFYGIAQQCLDDFNSMSKTRMNLVIFRYVLEHLSRICRILRVPGGNALLVGVGGSGRQSLTRLATHMSNMVLFQPEISKNYGKVEWREDVKVLPGRLVTDNSDLNITSTQIFNDCILFFRLLLL